MIEEVCSDLYDGFINAVEEVLPDAKIVADRFHVAKLYRAAVDEWSHPITSVIRIDQETN